MTFCFLRHCIAASHLILSTLVEMNVLGTFPFHINTFYRHLCGHRAGVAIFLALDLLKIKSAMRPLLNFIFTGIQLIIYKAKI